MNINITIEGVDGKDARQQLLNFLGKSSEEYLVVEQNPAEAESLNVLLQEQNKQTELLREQAISYSSSVVGRMKDAIAEPATATEEQPKKKRRTQAEIAAEREALEQQSKTGLTSTDETEPGTVEEPTPEETTVEEPAKEETTEENDFEAFLKANPVDETTSSKQAEIYFKYPIEFKSNITRDFLRQCAVYLGRIQKRDQVFEALGNYTIAPPDAKALAAGKTQLPDNELKTILDKFVQIPK